ncbi:gp1, partial [Sclerotinia sclerotiorum negative-stranded RNA virus 3-A]
WYLPPEIFFTFHHRLISHEVKMSNSVDLINEESNFEETEIVRGLGNIIENDQELRTSIAALTGTLSGTTQEPVPNLENRALISPTGEILDEPDIDFHGPGTFIPKPPSTAHRHEVSLPQPGIKNIFPSSTALLTESANAINACRERINALEMLVNSQGKQIVELREKNSALQVEIQACHSSVSLHKQTTADAIGAASADLRARIVDALSIYKETPGLVERLTAATNNILSMYPEELKTGLKKVELTKNDQVLMKKITDNSTQPKMKLPKHLRK